MLANLEITPSLLFAAYALLINLIAFIMYGIDKHRAQKRKERISEAALIWMAVFGGSVGAIMGMYIFHHKTQKKKFKILLPLIFFIQLSVLGYWIYLLAQSANNA